MNSHSELRNGFCIFTNTLCQGTKPLLCDDDGKYLVFETELDAQREIVDYQITRLIQFMDGDRDFEDAVTVDEFVIPVTVQADGLLVDEHGNCYDS
jgi:hypothetical protein